MKYRLFCCVTSKAGVPRILKRIILFLTERASANKTVDVIGWIITFIAYVFAILTFPVSVFCCVKVRRIFFKDLFGKK